MNTARAAACSARPAAGLGGRSAGTAFVTREAASSTKLPAVEPFHGVHQAGIVTPQQGHTYFAALDLQTTKRDDVVRLLRAWTDAAARMTSGADGRGTGFAMISKHPRFRPKRSA